ncbi:MULTISPECIES: hypothetical protein [Streptomycetaceae]|uniref:Uncharacterized protein n=1 Tax=Streptantibioticus cattleyicolor (strain ATCC 35852 / DSM 46488 / JCM 4925 / NBRC 14057 / NRRL 8057) TaxID=1003195 RepID=G8WMW2_STREN|nr:MULTISPECIES: hypothetical protein [Streptomycetaceae]AEW92681.1 hypothetical protein SCATT_03100 [Streptantibioticus cattleyicolor NRRL 8057 = DSM 46488]MYS57451.1 hypothetical protein [Streptomyces sp. SID5468]
MEPTQRKTTGPAGTALAFSTVAAVLAIAAPWARRTWRTRGGGGLAGAVPDGCHPPNSCPRRPHPDA